MHPRGYGFKQGKDTKAARLTEKQDNDDRTQDILQLTSRRERATFIIHEMMRNDTLLATDAKIRQAADAKSMTLCNNKKCHPGRPRAQNGARNPSQNDTTAERRVRASRRTHAAHVTAPRLRAQGLRSSAEKTTIRRSSLNSRSRVLSIPQNVSSCRPKPTARTPAGRRSAQQQAGPISRNTRLHRATPESLRHLDEDEPSSPRRATPNSSVAHGQIPMPTKSPEDR